MTLQEFIEYLESVMSSKETFYNLSMEDQLARNKRRAPAKRWNDVKMERVVDKQWKELMTNVYNTVKSQNKNAFRQSWIDFIHQNDFLENLDNSITEIEFD